MTVPLGTLGESVQKYITVFEEDYKNGLVKFEPPAPKKK